MSALNNSLLLGQEGGGGYAISRSLRFSSADSSFLSRTPASAGNRKTWTWAGWVKRSALGTYQYIWGNANSSAESGFMLRFENTDTIRIADWTNTAVWQKITTQVFRDVSAWYHIVVSYDTTNGTAADRVRFYVNGSRVTTFSTNTDPTQNYDGYTNNTSATSIGRWGAQADYYLNGYLADIHFIDGQALDPTSFGEFDATTGVWMPKQFAGSYGSQGWKLDFSDNSAATATTLGKDSSGNGNNWTPNNLSVTAGAGNDSLVDVPTNGSEVDTGSGGQVRGNYATLNPLDWFVSSGTLSEGNLKWVSQTTGDFANRATIAVRTGKWYWEITADSVGAGGCQVGIAKTSTYSQSSGLALYQANNGNKVIDNSSTSYGATWVTGDVIGVAYDADAGKITFYKNNSSQGEITLSGYAGIDVSPVVWDASSLAFTLTLNFGQRPFAYTAPSGFKALCTANLPAPVVTKPSTVMDVKLYTGNGGTQTISGLGFSPDFLWFKARSIAYSHALYDTVRGYTKSLVSNSTVAEGTEAGGLSAFNSDGFSLNGENTVYGSTNTNGQTYVAWAWDAGSSTVTNTSGSITSSVRANATAGFSIVTWTGTGASGGTIGHGLNAVPEFMICKSRTIAYGWVIYHKSLGGLAKYLLFDTDAAGTLANYWGTTAFTSSVFNASPYATSGANSGSMVAYCFAPVAGYSSFGSYTGNGSSDGPFVFTGMRPRWILFKKSSGTENWRLHDTERSTYNAAQSLLFPNLSNAETTSSEYAVDILSNGFKIRTNVAGSLNDSGATYVYAAFAESPVNYSRAR